MTLGRLVLAGIVVAAWFGIATVVTIYAMGKVSRSRNASVYLLVLPEYLKRRVVEATVLTLIASLWFESLGSGEWWLLFLLFGVLVSSSQWFRHAPDIESQHVKFVEVGCDLARYLGAGALLAWRLS